MKSGASRAAAAERTPKTSSSTKSTARGERGGREGGREGQPGRADLVDATQYDFDRLERAISGLVAQQAALSTENQALRARLDESESRIKGLLADLEGAQERRKTAVDRVDALIAELDRLDAALDGSMAASAAGAESSP